MRKFAHFEVGTVDETVSILKRYQGRAHVIAGGTDLLGKMKDEISSTYPEALINLKSIVGLDRIIADQNSLKIGALARLEDIATHPIVNEYYPALARAAAKAASPHLREMATIGGNICQDVRCWYYRYPHNRFPCLRKGGGRCYAIKGQNRYHSIFGGSVENGCYAVHPSDLAPALIVLDAKVKTSSRIIDVKNLFKVDVNQTTVLAGDEILTEFDIPAPKTIARSTFIKFSLRKTIDFPIVNCAASVAVKAGVITAARICLNAVYVEPYRAKKAEEAIIGKEYDEKSAEKAAQTTISDAKPLEQNAYMVQIAGALVKRAILGCKNDFMFQNKPHS